MYFCNNSEKVVPKDLIRKALPRIPRDTQTAVIDLGKDILERSCFSSIILQLTIFASFGFKVEQTNCIPNLFEITSSKSRVIRDNVARWKCIRLFSRDGHRNCAVKVINAKGKIIYRFVLGDT